jgi:hypothetical protein
MLVYKILRAPEWADFDAAGETQGAPVDLADGYIHFSTAAQAADTAAKHFAGEDGLWLVAVDAEALGTPEVGAVARRAAVPAPLRLVEPRGSRLGGAPAARDPLATVFPEAMS